MFILVSMLYTIMLFNRVVRLLALSLCISFAVRAQCRWSVTPGFSYGITPSYNVSSSQGRSMGIMWRGGVRAACFISKHIGLGAGVELSTYDYDMRYSKPGLMLHAQRQHYVELPLFMTWIHREPVAQGFKPVLSVTAGIMFSQLSDASFRDNYGSYTVSGNNRGDFRWSPVKALLYAGAAQRLWKRGELAMGLEFTSLLNDNISDHPADVKFLPGSLAALALRLGLNIWLGG